LLTVIELPKKVFAEKKKVVEEEVKQEESGDGPTTEYK